VAVQTSIFNKERLKVPGAVCLDGSEADFYISEGSGGNQNKFLIYFEGGAWCGDSDLSRTIESCYNRSSTGLGSSKDYPNTLDLTAGGVLSGDSGINPAYFDWTRVFFKYCDGSGHQGFRAAPVNYKGKDLFFRGHNITVQRLNQLDTTRKIFTNAEAVIVTGGSAGGLAAFHWADYVKSKVKGYVWTVPDSGIFLDAANITSGLYDYRTKFINLQKLANVDLATPVAGCNAKYKDELWRCMFAQYLYPFIQSPLFVVNSLYDSWSIPNILNIKCVGATGSLSACSNGERWILEEYKKNTTDVIKGITANEDNGAWAPACANHGYLNLAAEYSPNFRVPANSIFSTEFAIVNWILDEPETHVHIDEVSWPGNKPCSGEKATQLRQ